MFARSRSLLVLAGCLAAVASVRPGPLGRRNATLQAVVFTGQASGTTASLRGLSVVSDREAWASGTGGVFLHTTDAGTTWRADTVPGATRLDFRDVEAFGNGVAYLLSIGNGPASRIYKTTDDGRSWQLQFQAGDQQMFLDCLAFWDARHGIAFGDPVDSRFVILTTTDGGATWSRVPAERIPAALPGEAAFAASGTALVTAGESTAWIGTGGGAIARVFRTDDQGEHWTVVDTPVAAGRSSAGIFSLAFRDTRTGVAVGGDYASPADVRASVALTADGGRTWSHAGQAPYASAVAWLPQPGGLVAVGQAWAAYSLDSGTSWIRADSNGYNSVAVTSGGSGWAVGAGGRVARVSVH